MPESQYDSLSIALSDILKKLLEANIKTDRRDVKKDHPNIEPRQR